ncbi:TRAP transporter substrate-binding protein [bacterium]|nr:TRAP transporter substrate-binding protein [bacterium]
MKRNVFIKLLVVAFFVTSCLIVSSPALAADKVIKLRYSNFFPPPHKNSILSGEWAREIEKRTNGRVKITYYPGGTLTPAPQTYDSVVKGIADIGQTVLAYSRGRFPLTEVIDLPLGYTSGYQATKMADAYYQKFKPKEFDDTKIMYIHAHGPGLIQTKKVIKSLDEIKGMRIKATGLTGKIVAALGGMPTTMPMGETYDALQKGLADGVILPIEVLKGWRFGELLKCTVKNYGIAYSVGIGVFMNKGKWNSLPKDVQQVFEEVNKEWIEKQGKLWDELDREGEAFAAKMPGYTFVTVTKKQEAVVRKKVRPLLDKYVENAKAKGLPGDEVLKFCLDYLKTHP